MCYNRTSNRDPIQSYTMDSMERPFVVTNDYIKNHRGDGQSSTSGSSVSLQTEPHAMYSASGNSSTSVYLEDTNENEPLLQVMPPPPALDLRMDSDGYVISDPVSGEQFDINMSVSDDASVLSSIDSRDRFLPEGHDAIVPD